MINVTLQVLDGVDRGKTFAELPLARPITVGREEGNVVQLNDERVSRFHAKILEDQGQLVLTDLESTNGTRVNGESVQISILRLGDRIALGRSLLLFGSPEQIERNLAESSRREAHSTEPPSSVLDKTRPLADPGDGGFQPEELRFELNFQRSDGPAVQPTIPLPLDEHTPKTSPNIPVNLTPAQAAQLSELLLHFHQLLAVATESGASSTEDGGAQLTRAAWQRVLRLEMELARYLYRIGHPE